MADESVAVSAPGAAAGAAAQAAQTPGAHAARIFHEALIAQGLIIPTGIQGAFAVGARFEHVADAVNTLITRASFQDGAELMNFPPIMDRRILERAGYVDCFPELCGAVHSLCGNRAPAHEPGARGRAGQPWGDTLSMTEVVLNPSACCPLYPALAGALPEGGRLVTMLNWVYRYGPSADPTCMQSFRVREFVRAGRCEEVSSWREMWLQRGLELMHSLGLDACTQAGSDAMLAPAGKRLDPPQPERHRKYELRVSMGAPQPSLAVGSFNLHQQHFGDVFGIYTAGDAPAHTACLGFGLSRVAMALFRMHGFDVYRWPRSVRQRLWP